MVIIYICVFFLGAALASFINATIYRIDNDYKAKELLTESSHCESCKHKLSWLDLFPIFGYLINKGKCKYCGAKVNIYYPISELVLGTIFLSLFLSSIPYYQYVIVILLFILSTYDIKEMGIPKNLTHIFLGISILIFVIFVRDFSNLIIPVVIAVVFLLINLVKKSFGVGDILIILGLGILLNQKQMITFFWISIFVALLYSLVYALIARKNLKGLKIPMVPFLSIAYIIVLLFGNYIGTFLLNLLGM